MYTAPLQTISRSIYDMLDVGWRTTNDVHNYNSYSSQCGSEYYYGFIFNSPRGVLSATLRGSGRATLTYGTCDQLPWSRVNVYHNDVLISSAAGVDGKQATFDFSDGDEIVIEEVGIMKIMGFNVTCS